jgi:hypothetical protein
MLVIKLKSGLGAFGCHITLQITNLVFMLAKLVKVHNGLVHQMKQTVWELDKESTNEYHPTQKPIELPFKSN